jgi:catechol 2,3-dioxygenase-like lactoylglutathione lyase family enzyme
MSTTGTSIDRIANVVIPVADQDAMLAFYTGTLGMTVRVDVPMDGTFRWVEVGPGDGETTLAIVPPPPGGETGNRSTGITLQTRAIEPLYEELKAAGVDVDSEISRMGDPVPPMFWFRDPESNTLLVVEVAAQG